jgi:hypothetical protein
MPYHLLRRQRNPAPDGYDFGTYVTARAWLRHREHRAEQDGGETPTDGPPCTYRGSVDGHRDLTGRGDLL